MSTSESLDRMEVCESLLTWVSNRVIVVFPLTDGSPATLARLMVARRANGSNVSWLEENDSPHSGYVCRPAVCCV